MIHSSHYIDADHFCKDTQKPGDNSDQQREGSLVIHENLKGFTCHPSSRLTNGFVGTLYLPKAGETQWVRSPPFNPQCLSPWAPFLHSFDLQASTVPGSKLQTNQTVPDTAQNSTEGRQAQPGEVFQGHTRGHPVFTCAELGLEQPTCCLLIFSWKHTGQPSPRQNQQASSFLSESIVQESTPE